MANFIILIGGPGKFQACDKAHDQTWTNYIVPMQLAASQNLYKKNPGENVHWVVYEPPYQLRWLDDSQITAAEKKQSDGRWLHSIRKTAADKVKATGATSYIHRIKMIAAQHGITYKGISKPKEFWDYLGSFPKKSLSRVWYSGHASGNALLLSLTHDMANSGCVAGGLRRDSLSMEEISGNASLSDRFNVDAAKSSKFYGCYTSQFAQTWRDVFGVPAEGAVSKIDFGSVDRPSNIKNILERIQTTPTSAGKPGWETHK